MKTMLISLLFFLLAGHSIADESDDSFAIRGNGVLTHKEFDAWISRIPPSDRAAFLRDSKRLEQLLGQLLTNAQMAADAREAGFDQDETVQLRMQMAAENELAQAWTSHKVSTAATPDFEALAKEYYLLNPGEFMTARAISVTHLLVSDKTRADEEALEIARDLKQQLDADPSVFQDLISRHSDDPSAGSNKGHFTRVKKGDMVAPFENRAFTLQLGEISEPVKTEYGYHLIRLDEVHKSELMDFEAVKLPIMDRQRKLHENRVRNDYLNQLGSFETELPEDDLKDMLKRYYADSVLTDDTGADQE